MKTTIIEEVRRNRAAIAKECGYDIARIAEHGRVRAKELGFVDYCDRKPVKPKRRRKAA